MERNLQNYIYRIYALKKEPDDEFEKLKHKLGKKLDYDAMKMMFNNVLDIWNRGQELNIESVGKVTFNKKAEARKMKTIKEQKEEKDMYVQKLKNKYKLIH